MTPPSKKRARREPVTRERALAAAIEIADVGGLAELTMRRLADELGVEAMSLYHHVPNKNAILDGMIDLVFGQVDMPSPGVDWKTAMRRRAASMRSVLLRHRWALGVMESRRAPGPANLAHHDAVLGCLRAGGFSLALTAHAYAVLDAFIYGFVLTELSLPFETTEQTREVVKEIFDQFPAGAYPHLAELAREHVVQPGYRFADSFDYGLELVLDGLERARDRA